MSSPARPSRTVRAIVLRAALAAFVGTATAGYAAPSGPLATGNLYPPFLPFIDLPPAGATTGGQGSFRASVTAEAGNCVQYDPGVIISSLVIYIDAETERLTFAAAYGVLPRLDLGLRASWIWLGGGGLDAVIEGFHDLFGFDNGPRPYLPRNDYRFWLRYRGEDWINLREPASGPGDLTAWATWALVPPGRPGGFALAVRAGVQFPTGDASAMLSNGKLDWQVDLLADLPLGSATASLNLGYANLGEPEALTMPAFFGHALAYAAAFSWPVLPRLCLVAQVDGMTTPYIVRHFMLAWTSTLLQAGARFAVGDRVAVEACFSEEFFSFAASDFSVTATCSLEL